MTTITRPRHLPRRPNARNLLGTTGRTFDETPAPKGPRPPALERPREQMTKRPKVDMRTPADRRGQFLQVSAKDAARLAAIHGATIRSEQVSSERANVRKKAREFSAIERSFRTTGLVGNQPSGRWEGQMSTRPDALPKG